mmetsp:Transcript_41249/g.130738  ORF Transcript_41249/g.130738 Transcript_41249/m.130738 type:complete len:525 (-) Transcript_41249:183-1757(-)
MSPAPHTAAPPFGARSSQGGGGNGGLFLAAPRAAVSGGGSCTSVRRGCSSGPVGRTREAPRALSRDRVGASSLAAGGAPVAASSRRLSGGIPGATVALAARRAAAPSGAHCGARGRSLSPVGGAAAGGKVRQCAAPHSSAFLVPDTASTTAGGSAAQAPSRPHAVGGVTGAGAVTHQAAFFPGVAASLQASPRHANRHGAAVRPGVAMATPAVAVQQVAVGRNPTVAAAVLAASAASTRAVAQANPVSPRNLVTKVAGRSHGCAAVGDKTHLRSRSRSSSTRSGSSSPAPPCLPLAAAPSAATAQTASAVSSSTTVTWSSASFESEDDEASRRRIFMSRSRQQEAAQTFQAVDFAVRAALQATAQVASSSASRWFPTCRGEPMATTGPVPPPPRQQGGRSPGPAQRAAPAQGGARSPSPPGHHGCATGTGGGGCGSPPASPSRKRGSSLAAARLQHKERVAATERQANFSKDLLTRLDRLREAGGTALAAASAANAAAATAGAGVPPAPPWPVSVAAAAAFVRG